MRLVLLALAHAVPLTRALWSVNGGGGEVIGGSGRIGSLILRAGRGTLAAVPRGLAPGGLSPPGTPIIVAANTDALPRILRSTPEHRVRDLVLLCNGLARERCADLIGREHASQITAGVLYFGVLAPGADPVHGGDAPPTALAGPHANAVAALIEQMGPRCRVLDGLDALEPFAQRKMVWGAAMWLMCDVHRCTVSEVHDLHSAELRALVDELVAPCDASLSVNIDAVLAEMRAYSESMPNVVPSARMAKRELSDRNGWFLRSAASKGLRQVKHEALLQKAGVSCDSIERVSQLAGVHAEESGAAPSDDACTPTDESNQLPPHLHAAGGLSFHATRSAQGRRKHRPSSAIVVGGGMVGSAIALELTRRGVQVTVVDERPPPGPTYSSLKGDVHCVDATTGSWAWLNANGKGRSSPSYGALNRLGMHMWLSVAPYDELAVWCGSIVASADPFGDGAQDGAYAVRSSLSEEEVRSVEPTLSVPTSTSGGSCETPLHFHHYMDEGRACPLRSVSAVRAAAEAEGAKFQWSARVERLLYEGGDSVQDSSTDGMPVACGVSLAHVADGGASQKLRADVVVLAAGVGIGSAALGAAVPMLHSPGRLVHATPAQTTPHARSEGGAGSRMRVLFVDGLSGVHAMERDDRRLVIGGDLRGYGVASDAQAAVDQGGESSAGDALMDRATAWMPRLAEDGYTVTAVTHAQRVVPKDGFPAIGWSQRVGGYVCAAHSGITLAPVLAALAAVEIVEGVSVDLIEDDWRPDRFASEVQ